MARVGTASKNAWGFVPTTIPSCSLWLDAADPSTMFTDTAGTIQAVVGNSVARWNDKSISATFASQATSGNRPILQTEPIPGLAPQTNLTSLNFTGGSQLLALPNGAMLPLGTSDGTYFVVCRSSTSVASGSGTLMTPFSHGGGTAAAGQSRSFIVTPSQNSGFVCQQTGTITSINTYVPVLLTGGIKDYIQYGFANGLTNTGNNLINFQGSTFVTSGGTLSTNGYIGQTAGAGQANAFIGNVSEILVYNRALNNYERQQVEGYLALKWGITSRLPEATHPYYNTVAQGFNPQQLGSCLMWLDASTLTGTDNSAVTTWTGVVNSATNTGGSAPTLATASLNGRNTVRFNGSQFLNIGNGSLTANINSLTIFIVAQSTNGSATARQVVFTQGPPAYPTALNGTSRPVVESYFNSANRLSFDYYGMSQGSTPTSSAVYLNSYVASAVNFTAGSNPIVAWETGNSFPNQSNNLSYIVGNSRARLGASRKPSNCTSSTVTAPSTVTITTTGSGVVPYVNQIINFSVSGSNITSDINYYIVSVTGTSSPYTITIGTTRGVALTNLTNGSANGPASLLTAVSATTDIGDTVTIISSTLPTVNQPIMFETAIGGVAANTQYYILNVNPPTVSSSYDIQLSTTIGGSVFPITSNNLPSSSSTTAVVETSVENYMTGNIAEIIYYGSTNLSTVQRQRVEGYLAWKWGLQASLPTSHPFYLANYFYNSTRPTSRLFLPTDIEGCQVWMDPTDSETVGYAISAWNDKSGNSNNATQATASLRPYYIPSQKALYFGSTEYLNLLNSSSLNLFRNIGYASMYMVLRIPSGTALVDQNVLFTATTGTGGSRFTPAIFPSGSPNAVYGGLFTRLDAESSATRSSNGISYPYDGITILNFELNYSTNTYTLSQNGTQDVNNSAAGLTTSGLTSNTASTSVTISSLNTASRQNNFYIHEILLYTSSGTALTSTQRNDNHGYLAWKWGVQNSLPSTNTWSPFNTTPASAGPSTPVTGSNLWLDGSDASTMTYGTAVAMLTDKSGSDNAAVNNVSTLTMTTYAKPEGNTQPIILGPNPGTSNSLTTRTIASRDTSNHTYAFVAKYPGFNPTQIAGCALWLDASDGNTVTVSGSNVTAWKDKAVGYTGTASNNTAIQYISNALNGLPVIRVGSTAAYFTFGDVNNVGTQEFNIFAVARANGSIGNIGGIIGKGPGTNGWWFGYNPPSYLQTQSGSNSSQLNNTIIVVSGLTNYNVLSSMNPRTSATTQYLNGTSTGTGGSTALTISNTSALRVGSQGSNYTVTNTDFAEVILYIGAISTTQRQQIEGYLAWKWGLQANLPAGHPYLSVSPIITTSPTNVLSYYTPPTTAFTPTQISGCALWLDGADPLNNGTTPSSGATISTWSDKSGNGRNATVASGRVAGTFNTAFNCVYFQASSVGYVTSYAANPTNETMFIVANIDSPANVNNNTIIGGQLGARSFGFGYSGAPSSGIGFSSYLNNEVAWPNTSITGPATGVTALITGTVSSTTNLTVALNGGSSKAGTITAWTSGTTTYLGVDTTTTAYYYKGYVMEILFYNSVLTLAQRQQIEGYLAQKWGVAGSYSVSPNTNSAGGTETFGHSGTTSPILQNNNAIVGGGNTYAAYGTYASADAFYGGNMFVCVCVRQNGVWTFTTNGVSYTTVAPYALRKLASGQYTIQVNNNGGIQLGDVIVYNSAISPGERQQLEGYLAWKWGLQRTGNAIAPFPTTHPFYKNPPATTLPIVNAMQTYKKTFDITDLGPALWLDANDPTTYVVDGNNRVQWITNKGTIGTTKARFTISAVVNGTDFTINTSSGVSPGQAFQFSGTGVSFTGISSTASTPAAPIFFYVHSYFDTSRIRISSTFGGSPLTGTVSNSVDCYIYQRFTRPTGGVVVTAASGSGTVQTYTCVNNLNILQAGRNVTITGLSPAGFNVVNQPILTHSTTQITVAGATAGSSTGTGLASLPTQLNGPLLTQSAVGTGNGLNYLDFSSGGTFKITGGSTNSAGTSVTLTLNAAHNIPANRQVRVVVSGGTYSTDSSSATGITGTYIVSAQATTTITIAYTSSKVSATINNIVGYVEYGSIIIQDISMLSGDSKATFTTSFAHGLTTSDSIFLSLAGSTIANFPVALNLANGVYTPSAVTTTSFTIASLLNLGGSAIVSTGAITNTSLLSNTSPSYAYFPYNGYCLESMSATGMQSGTNGCTLFVVTHTNPNSSGSGASSIARCGRNVETQPPIFAVASTQNSASGTTTNSATIHGLGSDFNVRLANYNAVGNDAVTSTVPSNRIGIKRNTLSVTSLALTDTDKSITNTTNGFRIFTSFVNAINSSSAEVGIFSCAVHSAGWKQTGTTPSLLNKAYVNNTQGTYKAYEASCVGTTATVKFVPYGIEPSYTSPFFIGQIVSVVSLGIAGYNQASATITATPTLDSISYTVSSTLGPLTGGNGTIFMTNTTNVQPVSNHIRIGADTNATTSYSSLAGYLTDRFFDGGISEILLFNNATLTAEQRMLVEGYLAQKYNCQDYLGSSTNVITNDSIFTVNSTPLTNISSSGTTATYIFNPGSLTVNPFIPGTRLTASGSITPSGYTGQFTVISTSGINQVSVSLTTPIVGGATTSISGFTLTSSSTQANQFIHPYRAGPANIASNLSLGTLTQNLALWYDAANYSSLTLSGSSVLTWNSVLGNVAYATNVLAPINSLFPLKYVTNSHNGLPGLEVMSTVALTGVTLTGTAVNPSNLLTVTSSTPIVQYQLIQLATSTSGLTATVYYIVRSVPTFTSPNIYTFQVAGTTATLGSPISINLTSTSLSIACQLFRGGSMVCASISALSTTTTGNNSEFTYFYVFKWNRTEVVPGVATFVGLRSGGNARLTLGPNTFTMIDTLSLFSTDINYSTRGGFLINTPIILSVYKRGRDLYSRMIGGGKTTQFVQTFSRDNELLRNDGFQLFINAFNTDSQLAFNGTLYEMMFFRDGLTDQAIQQTEGYLAQKWGLRSSLPPTHSYYGATA